MSKLDLFKKKYGINNYKQFLCSICDTDCRCNTDIDPIPYPVWYAEYMWIKSPVKIDEEEDIKKENK
jgi:hypothetical protein